MTTTYDQLAEAVGLLEIALQQGGDLGGKRQEVKAALGYLRDYREGRNCALALPARLDPYRDYEIHPNEYSLGQSDRVAYHHRDYSGPEDPRTGTAPTVEAARAAIDERIDEGFDADAPPVGYVVRIGGVA